jgi:hypothetical protein
MRRNLADSQPIRGDDGTERRDEVNESEQRWVDAEGYSESEIL